MGHINLATPVVHILFLKSLPSRIALAVDMKLKNLKQLTIELSDLKKMVYFVQEYLVQLKIMNVCVENISE